MGLIERCYRFARGLILPHLRTDSLEKYLFHRSTRAHNIRTEKHLLLCDSCRDRLDEFNAFVQAIRDVFSDETPGRFGTPLPGGARVYAGGASGSASDAVK